MLRVFKGSLRQFFTSMTARAKSIATALFAVSIFMCAPAFSQDAPAATPQLKLTAQTTSLSIQQAIDFALNNSTGIKNCALEVGACKDRLTAARTHALPTVRLNAVGLQLLTPLNFRFSKGVFGSSAPAAVGAAASGVLSGGQLEGGPIPHENTNVNAGQQPILVMNAGFVQPLLSLPTISLRTKQASVATETAQQSLEIQRQQLVNQVKHVYYRALEIQNSLPILQASENLFREVDRTTEEHLKVKAVLLSDSIEVKQQLARLEYDALQTRNNLAAAKEELNHLIGRDARVDFTLVDVGNVPQDEVDLKVAQSKALLLRGEIKRVNSQAKQAELEKKIRQLSYLPELNFMVDYFSIFGAQEILPRNVVFAALVASWEPVDWGRRRAEINEQKKVVQQAKNVVSDLESQTIVEVNNAWRKLQETRTLVHVGELGQQLAAEKLRVLSNRYKEKSSLLKDVLQSQREVAQATNQYTQAILAVWSARADLEKAIGEE
jgi:outer membrane protein